METQPAPPTLEAFAAYAGLYAQARSALQRQARLIVRQAGQCVGRAATLAAFDDVLRAGTRGIVALEGLPGSGTTTLLCKLAAERRYAWWLRSGDDDGAELTALCAQVVALHGLLPPLVSPEAERDSQTLERLLEQAAAQRAADDPLVLLFDGWQQPEEAAYPARFPAWLPPNVLVLCTCVPGQALPLPASARLTLPNSGAALEADMTAALRRSGCAPHAAMRLIARSQGNFLYLQLGQGLFELGYLDIERLPEGLDELLASWWQQASSQTFARDMAALLAASSLALPPDVLGFLLDTEPHKVLALIETWAPLLERDQAGAVALAHPTIRAFLQSRVGPLGQRANEALAAAALRQAGPRLKPADAIHPALRDQLAANIAAAPTLRAAVTPTLIGRDWVAARERLDSLKHAASDAVWAVRAATTMLSPQLLAQTCVVAGTLSALSRTLDPDAVAEAFLAMLAHDDSGTGRNLALKQMRGLIEGMPEGRSRARCLRRLGEACYANGMRGAAMRLLSQALDMEDQTAPRSWQDEREQTLAGLAQAALSVGDVAGALEICVRIRHSERRGLSETEVVRWLSMHSSLPRAEKTATAISHEGMREWALAEVAVAYARGGDGAAAASLLANNTSPTASAWAYTELACDLAQTDGAAALAQVAAMNLAAHRDRAYGRVAQVLAGRELADEALQATTRIDDLVLRAEALIELAAILAGSADTSLGAALAEVQRAAATIDESARAPILAGLAAAQAACRQPDAARHSLELLEAGEERDRALGRVAVALARHDQIVHADETIRAISDDDERDWALSELARLLAAAGGWDAAHLRVAAIVNDAQRDSALTELVTLQARAGMPADALLQVQRIGGAASRARALLAVAVVYAASQQLAQAEEVLASLPNADAHSRTCAALAAALAGSGNREAALAMARRATRPADQARGLAEVAASAASSAPHLAGALLGEALLIAVQLGRAESLHTLEQVAPSLASLGGISALEAAAQALDDVDEWWRR